MSLYLKYRPKSLDEIYGNSDLVRTLSNILSDVETCPQVFMLHGPTGCGKTTIARIIADRLECKGMDLREVDVADYRGIDSIREIRKQAQFRPLEGKCKVWILDECHRLTPDAQSALLKILEDTPKDVYFILCTTDPQKVLPTIRGRCSQFQVKQLSPDDMFALLRSIVKAEEERLPKTVYDQIIQDSLGHPRNAIQTLEQVLQAEPEDRLKVAKRAAEEQSQSIELCRALLKGAGWKEITNILSGLQEQDPEGIRRHVLAYCNSILLKGRNDQAARVMEEFIEPFWNAGKPGLTLACYSVIFGE